MFAATTCVPCARIAADNGSGANCVIGTTAAAAYRMMMAVSAVIATEKCKKPKRSSSPELLFVV
jgi:hypothetical protein